MIRAGGSSAAPVGGLAGLYDRVIAASRAGDAASAQEAYLRAVGLRERRRVSAVPVAPPRVSADMLRFSEPRRIDLMALARGARRVAKFEDLAAGTARTLQARLEGMGLRVRVSGPYQKRFDVSVAAPGAVAELFTVVASWGQEADQVIDAEQDRTAQGTRRAGLALGYPPCCVEHFTSLERGPAAQAGGINEAAIRSPRGVRAPRIPWEMNPLCIHSPIGFTPCSVDCAGALAFARRVLEAVRQEHPASYETVQRALRRPILFFRFPLFHVLEAAPGPWSGEGARYRGAVAAVEPRVAPELAAWHEDEVGRALAEGDRVSLERGALQILRGDVRVARWTLEDPEIPLLLRFETGG